MSGGRSVLRLAWNSFINSIRPRQIRGNFIGEDYFGNKYYEIKANPGIGKRRTERWFEPSGDKEAFDRELTAEWEAWLRGRRVEPPTDEELSKNLAIMQMKKINAAKLEAHYSGGKVKEPQKVTGGGTFPTHDGYEMVAGAGPKKKTEK